jgi:GT2 family glycosyltransferase
MIDVIVVNWNSGAQLARCVESVLTHGAGCVQRTIVVDNGSADGSADAVAALQGVTLVRAGRNLGFAKACNTGAAHSDAEYILLLNPDARVLPGSLQAAAAFMGSAEAARVGIVGLRNVGDDGRAHRSCARFPTPWSFVVQSAGLSALWPRAFPSYVMREWPHDADRQVDHVIGSCYLVRSSVFQGLGGLDERFFLYLEDLDFSRRANLAGWATWFLARACVYHKGGGTSDQIKAKRLFYALRSRLQYAAKHFGPAGFAAVASSTLLLEPFVRVAGACARGKWSTAGETLEAYAALVRDLPNVLRTQRVTK